MTQTTSTPIGSAELTELADDAVILVQRWLVESREVPSDTAARRLAGVLSDPNGLDFTVGFVDGVVRPEDVKVAAHNLREIVPLTPKFLPFALRGLIRLGGALAPAFPGIVVPISRAVLRGMVRHLIVDATDAKLGKAIRRIRADENVDLNINLLGEAILGEEEAARRLEGTRRLLERDDVDYVSIKVSSTVAPHSPWAFDDAVHHAAEALVPLFRVAKIRGKKFINLDMEEFKDLDITIAVFTAILDREEFRDLSAGIVLQAYLPDALGAMIRLQEWSAARVAAGGAPVKVRVVKGANLPMEEVDAETHGWPLATWHSKQATDSSYKAVLDYALRPEHVENVRIGIAGHNLFDIALAWLLANKRGIAGPSTAEPVEAADPSTGSGSGAGGSGSGAIEFEMLLGMATAQATVVRRTVGSLLLYTPVVHPAEFDVAIAYLIRRLEEGASTENFMSAVFELDDEPALFARERDRFLASIASVPTEVPASNRVQDRSASVSDASTGSAGGHSAVSDAAISIPEPVEGFENTPDTDPSLAANRAWGDGIRSRMEKSELGNDTVRTHTLSDTASVDAVISTATAAAESWHALGAAGRAEILHRAGDFLEARRADLLEVMGSECGKILEQGDPEVSEAIDFAHYYAESAKRMENIDGATHRPVGLTVVTPPWNFPVAIPAGSTLSALAAGSPVIIKPARQARRSGAVMIEALWEAGVPRDVLQYVQLDGRELGTQLISSPAVERVILTGGYETAELFRSFRPDLPLLAETSGKNAIIVTPSADLDLAAKDVAYSAFGHAGQKCSAASLVILVGTVAESKRFRRQLIDAVGSYKVGQPWDESSRVGPLIGPAEGKLLHALTTLESGESWVIEPEKLDDEGQLWRPGVREGVAPGSPFHLTEYFGPVLGVMTAKTLGEATDMVNAIDYGLTSGLHSLDEDEIAQWLSKVQAGNLYVNRGITGAIVQRQPFGGWKKAAVGTGTKAGGPSYLIGLSDWEDAPLTAAAPTDAISRAALAAATQADDADIAWLQGALSSDVNAWRDEYAAVRDATGLETEHNALRYDVVPVTIRVEKGSVVEAVRVIAAGVRTGARLSVSVESELPASVRNWLSASGIGVAVEHAAGWGARAARLAETGGRIRLIGGDVAEVAAHTGGSPAVAIYAGPVLSAGRIEMLPYLREQAVSITAHRFGTAHRYDIAPLIA